jgi:hypothetical protein
MALSLHQKGLPVRVYEAVSDVRPLVWASTCSRAQFAS